MRPVLPKTSLLHKCPITWIDILDIQKHMSNKAAAAAAAGLNKHKAQHSMIIRIITRIVVSFIFFFLYLINNYQLLICVWNQDIFGIQRSLTKWNWWRLRSDCPGNSQQKGPWKAKMDVPKSHNYISSPSLLRTLSLSLSLYLIHTLTNTHIWIQSQPIRFYAKSNVFSLEIMHPLAF